MTVRVLGVDAGNTKTIAAVADGGGRPLGSARGGLGDIYGVADPREAIAVVLALADEALDAATAAGAEPLTAAAFRLAGVDWPEDAELWREAIAAHFGDGLPVSVLNDGFAPLRCGDPDGIGVAVSLGTGAAIAGRGPDGAEFAVSWWLQHPLGGAGIVEEALHAVYLAEIGMAPATALTAKLAAFYGAASAQELLHTSTRRGGVPLTHHTRARAARVVVEAAEAGDAVALAVVREQAVCVAQYVRACAERVRIGPDQSFAVTLGGSVAASPLVRHAIREQLEAAVPNARVVRADAPPILGTVLDALAEAGITDAATRATILAWDLGR